MKLNDKAYDILKWICLIVLPAIAVLYGTLSKIWDLPFSTEIPATLNAIGVFIGVLIGVSQYNINKES